MPHLTLQMRRLKLRPPRLTLRIRRLKRYRPRLTVGLRRTTLRFSRFTLPPPRGKRALPVVKRDEKEAVMGALGALDPGFLAQASGPFVGAGRLVAGLASPAALETARIDVVASAAPEAETD